MATLIATELAFNGNQLEGDYNGKAAAQRRFVVQTMSKQAAIVAENIPALSSEHPDFPKLVLDQYVVTVAEQGVCYVDCRYSNDRRYGSVRTPNKDNPTWFEWGWDMKQVTVDIPIWSRVLVLATGGNGDQNAGVLVYKIGKLEKIENRIVRPLRVRVKISNVRDLDVISQQTNKIHGMPDGRDYLFTGGRVSQVDDTGVYDISYVWEYDEGTFTFPPFSGPYAGYCHPVGDPARQPYTVFYSWQDGNPATTMPKRATMEQYDKDYDGWRRLPGASRII